MINKLLITKISDKGNFNESKHLYHFNGKSQMVNLDFTYSGYNQKVILKVIRNNLPVICFDWNDFYKFDKKTCQIYLDVDKFDKEESLPSCYVLKGIVEKYGKYSKKNDNWLNISYKIVFRIYEKNATAGHRIYVKDISLMEYITIDITSRIVNKWFLVPQSTVSQNSLNLLNESFDGDLVYDVITIDGKSCLMKFRRCIDQNFDVDDSNKGGGFYPMYIYYYAALLIKFTTEIDQDLINKILNIYQKYEICTKITSEYNEQYIENLNTTKFKNTTLVRYIIKLDIYVINWKLIDILD
tara:strand:+ start:3407 stop:4300 length:894 start_codon:yes stop_codon:yes gene_type:complete